MANWLGAYHHPEPQQLQEEDVADCFEFLNPARLQKKRPEELWRIKRAIEDAYGNFWEEDPTLDIENVSKFDQMAFLQFLGDVAKETGWTQGAINIAFDELSVSVPLLSGEEALLTNLEAAKSTVLAPWTSLFHFVRRQFGLRKGDLVIESHKVLDGVSGYVTAGEMLLVVGPPGAGSSSLLQLLSMRGAYFENRSGNVLYNGLNVMDDYPQFLGACQKQVAMVGQLDEHLAPLSVRDTLDFASECVNPDILPYAERIRKWYATLVARALGIERVFGTAVGDEYIRGVSGGEKRRVSIAEMMLCDLTRVVLMDSFNKGLDAAATLDITLLMKDVAKIFQQCVIAVIQQPSDGVFFAFDKVLVLDEGKAIFFGKPSEAVKHFESLGFRQPEDRSAADFVCTVSDPAFRHEMVPEDDKGVPDSVDDFVKRYQSSTYFTDCRDHVEKEVQQGYWTGSWKEHVNQDVVAFLKRESLNPVARQCALLLQRNVKLEILDKWTVLSILLVTVVIGLILGTLFLNTENTQDGATTRSGLIFIVMVYISLSSVASLNKKYALKKVYLKQREACFYGPGPFILSAVIVDAVLLLVQTILFSLSVYWLANLNRDSGRFAIFLLVNWLLALTIDALVRVLSVAVEKTVASGLLGLIILIFNLFSGYLIPESSIGGWFVWMYWISPIQYAFQALITNEFYGRPISCSADERLPSDPTIPDDVKICPFVGGESFASNALGIREGFDWVWWNTLILIGFVALFTSMAIIFTFRLRSREYKAKRLLNDNDNDYESEYARRPQSSAPSETNPSDQAKPTERFQDAYLVWKDLSYTVPVGKNETKKLLNDIHGFARPGRLTALMGSSGAGKTTLMDVVAKRKTKGTIDGQILVNRTPQDEFFSRISGYVEQMDIHYPKLTVRESLEFSARLRLPESVPESDKQDIVEQTLDVLLLRDRQNDPVGTPGVDGLPPEARKRLTIGVELVAKPSVLFLDEPTSGLDSRAALLVTRVMRNIANLGCSIVCTIHQPSIEIFSQFDELLLLQRGGETVYFGELGPSCKTLVDYFERNGAEPLADKQNPADYMLLQIGAGLGPKKTDQQNWHETWKASPEAAEIYRLTHDQESELVSNTAEPFKFATLRATSMKYRLLCVLRRIWIMRMRSPEYIFVRFVLCLFQGLLLGFTYFQVPNNQQGAFLITSALFLSILPASLQMPTVMVPIIEGRAAFYRELAAGMFSEFEEWLALALIEIPSLVFSILLFQVIFYFTIGFTASRFGYFFLLLQLFTFWCVAVGQFFAIISPNMATAQAFPAFIDTLGNVLAGFLIRKAQIPPWYIWIYWSNPYSYYLGGVLVNEMSEKVFKCDADEYVAFQNPQPTESCMALSSASFEYMNKSPDSNETCLYCPITSGEDILRPFGVGEFSKWINAGALVGFWLLFLALQFLGFKYIKHQSR